MESDEKPKRVKVGFEITEFMSSDIDILYKELGYNDRAEFMRDAIREKIDRIKKESGQRSVLRTTTYVSAATSANMVAAFEAPPNNAGMLTIRTSTSPSVITFQENGSYQYR